MRSTLEIIPPQPEKTVEITRHSDAIQIDNSPGADPIITATRRKRRDGFVESETPLTRVLSKVGDQPFGNSGLTVAQAFAALDETLDRWAIEDNEP